ncbi:hypothetical protein P3S68_013839 [Capsicum galapagoense]
MFWSGCYRRKWQYSLQYFARICHWWKLSRCIGKNGLPGFEVKSIQNQFFWDLVLFMEGVLFIMILNRIMFFWWVEKTAKLADFGFAQRVGIERQKKKLRGTPMYMAPESVLDGKYGTAVDIWAFGCTVFEMITGKKILDCTGINDTLHLLCKIGMQSPDLHGEKLSRHTVDFLNKCLATDPCSRWTADMLLNHPFLSTDNCVRQERKMKELNPVNIG